MHAPTRHGWFLGIVWLAITGAGCAVVLQTELEHDRTEFVLEAQGLHRLMAQQMHQHERLTEALVASAGLAAGTKPLAEGLLQWYRQDAQQPAPWPEAQRAGFEAAAHRSLRTGRPAATAPDVSAGHYWLVLQQGATRVAAQFGLRPPPVKGATEPFAGRGDVWVRLEHEGQQMPLLPTTAAAEEEAGRWRFVYRQRLAQDDLGLEVVAVRRLGWAALPWRELASWSLLTTLLAMGAAALLALRRSGAARPTGGDTLTLTTSFFDSDFDESASARNRAGGGLNSGLGRSGPTPLMMTLRELDIEPPELTVARGAIREASRQARRTSAVIDDMRRKAEDGPGADTHIQPVAMDDVLLEAVDLLRLGCDRLGVACQLQVDPEPCHVLADALVLEQLLHRLFGQSLQAVQHEPPGARRLLISLGRDDAHAVLSLSDSSTSGLGQGVPDEASQRLAESMGARLETGTAEGWACTRWLRVPLSA